MNLIVEGYQTNVQNSLVLMVAGMAGILIVMGLLIAAITILNKATKKDENEDNQ